MHNTGFFSPVLNFTGLGRLYRSTDINCDRTQLRVRHQAAWAQHLAKPANHAHHVRAGNDALEVGLAALDGFGKVLGTDQVGASFLGFIRFGIAGKHSHTHGFASTVRHGDNTAHHLVGVTWVNTEVHGNFDCLIEF